jgi:ribosomal protein S18 acetylase RimI-like enzyme
MRRIAIRPATEADLPAAAAIAAARSATKWSETALRGELSAPDAVFLVATDGDAVRGYAVARAVEEELRLLDIVAEADGKGVGRALWAGLIGRARADGLTKLSLEVSAANERARDFYKTSGAIEVGRRPRFYSDGSDAILMDAGLTTDNVTNDDH